MSSPQAIPSEISGYSILPLILPTLPAYPIAATHYLYVSLHQPRVPTASAQRSLFLVNVPFDATDAQLKHLLSLQLGLPNGRIEAVQFEDGKRKFPSSDGTATVKPTAERKGKKRKRDIEVGSLEYGKVAALPPAWGRELREIGSTAVVAFVDRASMDACLKAIRRARKDKNEIMWGEGAERNLPALGFARYLNHHKLRYPDKAQLLESVNINMTAFAAQEASQARLQTRQRQEADDDGFVKVTRGGRVGPARQEAAQEQSEKQKQKQKGLEDFYRFQTRERRKARAGDLVRKFEEDKEKVKRMRERRGRFRPE